jgi:hypothetical protein
MASQARRSIRVKTPSLKSLEASQQPPYRRRGASKQGENYTQTDSDAEASTTHSDEEIRIPPPPANHSDDEESFFDQFVTFEAVHMAFVDKEKVYTKFYDFAIGKWDPAKFDEAATSAISRDAAAIDYMPKLRNKMVSILAHGKKAFENTLEDEDDVRRVNDKIKCLLTANVKNVRVEYIVRYTNVGSIGSSRKHMREQDDSGPAKKPKVHIVIIILKADFRHPQNEIWKRHVPDRQNELRRRLRCARSSSISASVRRQTAATPETTAT